MSRSQLWNYVVKGYCKKNNSEHGRSLKKIVRYAAVGIGCATLAATPVISQSDDSGDTVASVNGALRFLRSIKLGLWISVDYYFSMLGLSDSSPNFKPMMSRLHQRAANKLLEGCLLNGGSYIKLGQSLVSLSHILPKEYIETLKALQDKCLARKFNEVEDIFQEDFGKGPLEIFESFDNKPIAAASIAQVYKAKTKDNQIVAVKVQYKDLRNRFKSDVETIDMLLKIAAFMHPNFNFTWVLKDLQNALQQELDFINEGRNSERCAKDLSGFNYIHVPKVYWDHTSVRVLVTEFIDGYKISDVNAFRKNGFSLADINNKLFEAFGHQIFQTGFVHADPHPGNVLVRRKNGTAQLVILDHGLYQNLSSKDRIALSYMWKAIVLNDHANMKKFSNQLGVENYELFAEILTQTPLKSHGFKLKAKLSEEDLAQMTEFAKNRFDSIITCLQAMPHTLLLVIRNLNTIRAIAHDHGSPIDRYAVLARMATKTAYGNENGFTRKIVNYPFKLYFEVVLNLNRVGRWFRKTLMVVLSRFGMVPDLSNIMTVANRS